MSVPYLIPPRKDLYYGGSEVCGDANVRKPLPPSRLSSKEVSYKVSNFEVWNIPRPVAGIRLLIQDSKMVWSFLKTPSPLEETLVLQKRITSSVIPHEEHYPTACILLLLGYGANCFT